MFTTRSTLSATIALPYLLPLVSGCGAAADRPGFEAEVRGAIETTMHGVSRFSPSALTLSTGESSDEGDRRLVGGTLVFAASDGAGLTSGSYDVSRRSPGSRIPFVNTLYIAGTPSRPIGVFRGSAGALTITTATEQRIAGRFELDAVGVINDAGGDTARRTPKDSATVHVSGSFLVLEPCSAVTSRAAAPCARRSSRATDEPRLRAVAVALPQSSTRSPHTSRK